MDIKFDDAAAQALIGAAQDTASVCAGVQHNRSISLKAVFDTCAGSYFDLFKNATKCELDDRQKIIGVLYKLEAQINNAIRYANFERERRELQQLLEAECKKSTDTDTEADRCMRKMSISSGPQPRISVDFIATPRPRTIKLSEHHDMVSADTEVLHGFVDDSAKIEAALKASFERLYQAWHTFLISCAWVRIESNSLIPTGLTAYCDENEADRHWIETIAHAFEEAESGSLSSIVLSVELSKGNTDEISRVLSDKSLTKDELKNAVERYMKDPLSRKVVVKYYEGMMRYLDFSDDDAKISRALVVSEAIASDPQTSGEVLQAFGGKDFAFTLMAWEDRVGLPTNVKKVREALKSIFIAGEPYLAQVDPQISKKFAEEIWCPECLENGVDLDKDPSSLVHFKDLAFLLDNAKLSTAFLSRMGELIDLNFRVLAGDFSDTRRLLQPVTQAFMSALALNSEASLDFFTKGEYFDSSQKLSPEMREKQEFWIQKQSANIEVFASISAALKSATTSLGQLGTRPAAGLVSSMNYFLSKRTREEGYKLGSFAEETNKNLTAIYATYFSGIAKMYMHPMDYSAQVRVGGYSSNTGINKNIFSGEYLPLFNPRDLDDVLREVINYKSGISAITNAYAQYQTDYFKILKMPNDSKHSANEMIYKLGEFDAKLNGHIRKALNDIMIYKAEMADDQISNLTNAAGFVISLASSFASFGTSLAITIGGAMAPELIKDTLGGNLEDANKKAKDVTEENYSPALFGFIKNVRSAGFLTDEMITKAAEDISLPDKVAEDLINALESKDIVAFVNNASSGDMYDLMEELAKIYGLGEGEYYEIYHGSVHTDGN